MIKQTFLFPFPFPFFQNEASYLAIIPFTNKVNLLFKEEQIYANTITAEKRKARFITGRLAARYAIQALQLEAKPILKKENGAPLWQDSILGSISFSDQYAIAWVVKKTDSILSIGIDIESKNRKLPFNLTNRVCHLEEQGTIDTTEKLIQLCTWKESCFKALSSLSDLSLLKKSPTWRQTYFKKLTASSFTLANQSSFLPRTIYSQGYSFPCLIPNCFISCYFTWQ